MTKYIPTIRNMTCAECAGKRLPLAGKTEATMLKNTISEYQEVLAQRCPPVHAVVSFIYPDCCGNLALASLQ